MEASPAYLEVVEEAKSLEECAEAEDLHHSVAWVGSCQAEADQKNSLPPCLDYLACHKGQRECTVGHVHPDRMVQEAGNWTSWPEPIVELQEEGCLKTPEGWKDPQEAAILPDCWEAAWAEPVAEYPTMSAHVSDTRNHVWLTEIGGILALFAGWY